MQVWKQRGEEYRITGGDGWLWTSITRVGNYTPQDTVGLRSVAVKIRTRRLKTAKVSVKSKSCDGAKDLDAMETDDCGDVELDKAAESVKSPDEQAAIEKDSVKEIMGYFSGGQIDKENDSKVEDIMGKTEISEGTETFVGQETSDSSNPKAIKSPSKLSISELDRNISRSSRSTSSFKTLISSTRNWGNFSDRKDADLAKEVFSKMPDKVTEVEIINVSDAMQNRTYYPKVTKPYSKLDSLLERRVKQEEIETKQRHALEQQILWKTKFEEKARLSREGKDTKPKLESLVNGLPQEKPIASQITCYSPLCRQEAGSCYSPICRASSLESAKNKMSTLVLKMEVDGIKEDVLAEANPASLVAEKDLEALGTLVNETVGDVTQKHVKEEPVETEEVSNQAANISLDDEEIDVEGDKETENSSSSAASDKLLNSVSTKSQNQLECREGKTKMAKDSLENDEDASEMPADANPVKSVASNSASASKVDISPEKSNDVPPGIKDAASVAHILSSRSGLTLSQAQLALTQAIIKMSKEDLRAKIPPIRHTQDKFKLPRLIRPGVKQRSKNLKKASLPVCQKFQTPSKRKSIFVLESHELHKLSRCGGLRETPGFNYNCKMNNVGWIYPCPRPYFKTAWRYRTQTLTSLAASGLQLRILWACTRWDDLSVKPPAGGTNTISTETEITTTELLKRRDIGPHGLRSEFLVRKIVVPLGIANQPKGENHFLMNEFLKKLLACFFINSKIAILTKYK